ncbi:hypothetical protein D9611_006194 [Ephemerocybe angulata]|uniref:Uncharacterized protein n=1 Tax=Ephemerocybe angulata TaxID=980116 RepID=A0A8H5FGX2_9AGAR|nr:hypothetical protein D9611_006194 [Tulosesus angulatus]
MPPSSSTRKGELSLSYALPAAIESLKDGWQRTAETGATISSLFSLLSLIALYLLNVAGLLDQESRDPIRTFLALASYGALFFNLSASISGFILIDRLGSIPYRAAQQPRELLPVSGVIDADSEQLLRRYGVGKLWGALVLHCEWFIASYMSCY